MCFVDILLNIWHRNSVGVKYLEFLKTMTTCNRYNTVSLIKFTVRPLDLNTRLVPIVKETTLCY